ncbi:MAG: methylmalonyl-CoA mutase, partial [Acidimicrobiales bacterium]
EATGLSSQQPVLFLANLGDVATHTARSTFAKSLFEAGGIRVEGNDGFDSARDCVEAFSASGCTVACICSSNQIYTELGAEVARQLRSAGAQHIYLAGSPDLGENLDGEIDDYVYLGCNVLDALAPIHQLLSR